MLLRTLSGTPHAPVRRRCDHTASATAHVLQSSSRSRTGPARVQADGTDGSAAVATDENVPEAHKGLHDFLYGADGADVVHGASGTPSGSSTFREGEDDGSTLLPVASFMASHEGEKPLGVYAVYDAGRSLQYVGFSRDILLAVQAHLARVGGSRCAFVRLMVFADRTMATRAHMERQAEQWIAEAGAVPPGNGPDAALWGSGAPGGVAGGVAGGAAAAGLDPSLMSPARRAEYEERKLKLRKAMGESLHDEEDGGASAQARRLALLAAVEGDNWSAVVGQQTQETLQGVLPAGSGSPGPAASGGVGTATSPFADPAVHLEAGAAAAGSSPPPAMTRDSVDAALDEVRPYLLADGGDVSVVGVEGGVVAVALHGACGSCASSGATLKMGIERRLAAVFGDQLVEVVQVEGSGSTPKATAEAVDLLLNSLRSAVAGLGGAVEVESVRPGEVVLRFRGPAAIGKGIAAAVRDAFPDVDEVVLRDGNAGPAGGVPGACGGSGTY